MGQLKKIIIGATGDYRVDNVGPIYGIWIKNKYTNLNGMVLTDAQIKQINSQIGTGASISYQYDVEVNNIFNSIESIKTNVGKSFQQIGASKKDLVSDLTNAKEEVTFIGMSNFFKRPVERLYYKNIEGNLQEENIFDDTILNNFRSIKKKYLWKLSWDLNFDDPTLESIYFYKTPNTNGLSEDWWDVQDWARYYAKVNMLINKIDPDTVSEDDYWEYYPMNNLKWYKKDGVELPTYAQVAEFISGTESQKIGTGNLQMIIQQEDGSWSTHGPSCTHSFFEFIPNFEVLDENGYIKNYYDEEHNKNIPMKTTYGINENTKVYIYKPTFPGEIVSTEGQSVIDLTPYFDTELFDDEESMLYSPFSLYVLKDDILSIKGEDKRMAGHLNWDSIPADDDRPHATGHLFERYYIDRYINAYSPQEELEAYSNAWKKYVLLDREDEDKELILEWLEEHPMFVLDAWTGNIHQVGENWLYEPSFIYNNEEIDLREIERYNLDGLNPAETNIKVGNGVWADIYYQNVEKTYSFEKKAEHYNIWNNAREYAKNNKNSMQALKEEKDAYEIFLVELQELIDAYTEKEA